MTFVAKNLYGKLPIILCLLLLFGGAVFFKLKGISDKIFINNQTDLAHAQIKHSLEDHLKNNTAFNILLLGYGGGQHDGAYLTDSIILVHIDPAAKKTTLVSVPRDIWVKIPTSDDKGSFWKINAAYELGLDDQDYPKKQARFKGRSGGGNLAKYVTEEVTGLPIDGFVALDFDGFKKSIDTIGGVDINVEKTFDDPEYPVEGKEADLCGHLAEELPTLEAIATISATQAFPCRYENLHFDQGLQHLDGERALKYVRSRHSLQDGTDFGRSKRQRNLLVAVKQKVLSIGFLKKAVPFLSSLQDDVRTDLQPQDINFLINEAGILDKYTVSNLALSDQNVLVSDFSSDGQYILLSNDGLDKWDSLHSWLTAKLSSNQEALSPVIKIENGTNVAGLATLAHNRLADKDFNVLPPFNSDRKTQTTSITVLNSHVDPRILNELKTEFNVSKVEFTDSGDAAYDILITLGDDYNLIQGKKLVN